MGLNNVRLTSSLLVDLYRNVLLEATEQPTPARLRVMGENKKEILIVVGYADAEIIGPADLGFLKTILAACKLHLADVAILNWQHLAAPDYKQVLQQFKSRFVLLFDVTPQQFGLPLHFPPFQLQGFDSRQYLFAPALSKIAAHKGLKGELWTALQKLFLL